MTPVSICFMKPPPCVARTLSAVAFIRRHTQPQQLIVVRHLCATSWQHSTSFTLLLTQLDTKVSDATTATRDAQILFGAKLQECLRKRQRQEKLLQVSTLCFTWVKANFAGWSFAQRLTLRDESVFYNLDLRSFASQYEWSNDERNEKIFSFILGWVTKGSGLALIKVGD